MPHAVFTHCTEYLARGDSLHRNARSLLSHSIPQQSPSMKPTSDHRPGLDPPRDGDKAGGGVHACARLVLSMVRAGPGSAIWDLLIILA